MPDIVIRGGKSGFKPDRLRPNGRKKARARPRHASGDRRFVQKVDGYEMTIAAGTPIFEHGEHTDALPGRLVRAGREAQILHAAE